MKNWKKRLFLSAAVLMSISTSKAILAEDSSVQAPQPQAQPESTSAVSTDLSTSTIDQVMSSAVPVAPTTEVSGQAQSDVVPTTSSSVVPSIVEPSTTVPSESTVPSVSSSATPSIPATPAPTQAPVIVPSSSASTASQSASSSSTSASKANETSGTPSVDTSSLPKSHNLIDLSKIVKSVTPKKNSETKRETVLADLIGYGLYNETFEIQLKNQTKEIKKVAVAIWNEQDGQDDLKWLVNNGTKNLKFDIKDWNNQAGKYQVHVYIEYKDGSKKSEPLGAYEIKLYKIDSEVTENAVKIDLNHKLEAKVTGNVAVWSDELGQETMEWYKIGADGTVEIPNEAFEVNGTYRIHTYVKQKGKNVSTSAKILTKTDSGITVKPDYPKVTHSLVSTSLTDEEITVSDAVAVQKTASNAAGNLYPVGQCTWGVKAVASWASNSWGNGAQWAYNASREGFLVGTTPVPGAIASWDDGGYGHVAYVTDVQSTTKIKVVESNVDGNQNLKDHRGWLNPLTTVNGPVLYIYPVAAADYQ